MFLTSWSISATSSHSFSLHFVKPFFSSLSSSSEMLSLVWYPSSSRDSEFKSSVKTWTVSGKCRYIFSWTLSLSSSERTSGAGDTAGVMCAEVSNDWERVDGQVMFGKVDGPFYKLWARAAWAHRFCLDLVTQGICGVFELTMGACNFF